MATPRKLKLPNLPFRPFALKLAGDQQLMLDLPKADQAAALYASRLTHRYGGLMTTVDLAAFCCVDPNMIKRWFKHGIRWTRAEDLCDQLGFHPVEVWPDYYQLLADAEYEFVVGMKDDDLVDDKIMEKIGGL